MAPRLHWQRDGIRLFCGDAIETLRTLPAESVHCVVTSPPYWGLLSAEYCDISRQRCGSQRALFTGVPS